ncbi:MAG: glutamate/gamma-aminobutyrate family transporter YjeM [Clostridium sp.]|nr:glutamate/gamma-aminobutyrate family transporter YjeM [Clostridium sp.]MDU7084280.1 glutamate/gamma-aminobutyrate family transporter YjeM [Clostridium sp.]
MTETQKKKTISMGALILMTFTTVYGFNNMPRSFYLMGYSAIPFFLVSVLLFFIPFAFMMAEYGAAFKNESGGIYSWMEKSVNSKYAFVVTVMWYASIVILMVNLSTAIWIPLSNAVFGTDTTGTWSLFGLSSTKTLGVLASLWIATVTFISAKGIDKVKKVTSVGGVAVMALNLILIGGGLLVLIGNGGQLAQPFKDLSAVVTSPNPGYQNPLSMLSFLVFTLFAFGGIEVIGGLVDKTENPEKNFPKGLLIASVIIGTGYAIGIFAVGIFTNWEAILGITGQYGEVINLGNATYLIMNNLGYQIGAAFGATESMCMNIGNWTARIVGISMVLSMAGAFFTLTFAPLKQLIAGCPKGLLPDKITELKDGMPVKAMILQGVTTIVIVLLVAFGGDVMAEFFDILVAMTNVAMTLPYMFISAAFIGFKRKEEIHKPYVVFKNKFSTIVITWVVTGLVAFANLFSIVEPAINGNVSKTLWSIAGPVFFIIIALTMYGKYEKDLSNENLIYDNK